MTKDLAVPASAAALIRLDDPACEAPAFAGNKAATLAVLRRAGFEVSPSMAIRGSSSWPTVSTGNTQAYQRRGMRKPLGPGEGPGP
jgi:hypothetical protein